MTHTHSRTVSGNFTLCRADKYMPLLTQLEQSGVCADLRHFLLMRGYAYMRSEQIWDHFHALPEAQQKESTELVQSWNEWQHMIRMAPKRKLQVCASLSLPKTLLSDASPVMSRPQSTNAVSHCPAANTPAVTFASSLSGSLLLPAATQASKPGKGKLLQSLGPLVGPSAGAADYQMLTSSLDDDDSDDQPDSDDASDPGKM